MKKLIINADDYGRTAGVSAGIRRAHTQGVVTSTTVMINMPGVEKELDTALRDCPQLGMGLHLVLTSGKPLLPAGQLHSILLEGERFPGLEGFEARLAGVNPYEAAAEWHAQVEKFIRVTGRKPDHLDSHHHSSYFTAGLLGKMLDLAQELDCPIRSPLTGLEDDLFTWQGGEPARQVFYQRKPRCPQQVSLSFYDQDATQEHLLAVISSLPEGISELMCHPGLADAELYTGSIYNAQREVELAALTDAAVRSAVHAAGVQLIHFGVLSAQSRNVTFLAK